MASKNAKPAARNRLKKLTLKDLENYRGGAAGGNPIESQEKISEQISKGYEKAQKSKPN